MFLAIAFRDLKKRLLIRGRDGIELPLDEELPETIVRPEQFTIELIGLDVVKEEVSRAVSKLVLAVSFREGKMSHNYAYPVGGGDEEVVR